jgi:enoyl-CoA hydratase/carnithine racemase
MKVELKTIYYEEKNDIGYLILNDPPANKMTSLFFMEINQIVRSNIAGSKVKGIIISGNGRHYSSGADVDELKQFVASLTTLDENENVIAYPTWLIENRTTFNFFYTLKIPVISAVNGLCVGSGTELALCSHIRICGTGSIMGLPEAAFGFLPGACGTIRLLEILGLGKTLELIISGETFSCDDALELGLIDLIVNKKETIAYCEGLMNFILNNAGIYLKQNIPYYLSDFNKNYQSRKI